MSSLTGAPSSLLSLSWPLFLVMQDSDPTRPFEGIAALLCALKIPHRPFLQQCPYFLPHASTLQAPQADWPAGLSAPAPCTGSSTKRSLKIEARLNSPRKTQTVCSNAQDASENKRAVAYAKHHALEGASVNGRYFMSCISASKNDLNPSPTPPSVHFLRNSLSSTWHFAKVMHDSQGSVYEIRQSPQAL